MGAARPKRRDRRETAGVRLHWRDLGRPRADRAATAVDVHSHAGNLIRVSHGSGSFAPVAEPMRQGGVSAICLAVVADSPIIRTMDGRLRSGRDPRPGELYDYTQRRSSRSMRWQVHSSCRCSGPRRISTGRAPAGRRSLFRRKAAISSRAGSSDSTRPTGAGRCGICSLRTIGPTSWATSRPSPACMAASHSSASR